MIWGFMVLAVEYQYILNLRAGGNPSSDGKNLVAGALIIGGWLPAIIYAGFLSFVLNLFVKKSKGH